MHKNSIFFYISPSFIGVGAPYPPKVNEGLYRHKRRDYDILVSLCFSFSFPFLFLFFPFPFSPLFFFFWWRRGGGRARRPPPPWIRAWLLGGHFKVVDVSKPLKRVVLILTSVFSTLNWLTLTLKRHLLHNFTSRLLFIFSPRAKISMWHWGWGCCENT